MKHRKVQRSQLFIESEKSYKIAELIESGDIDKIHKMYCDAVEAYGGEGGATCYFKVIGSSIK